MGLPPTCESCGGTQLIRNQTTGELSLCRSCDYPNPLELHGSFRIQEDELVHFKGPDVEKSLLELFVEGKPVGKVTTFDPSSYGNYTKTKVVEILKPVEFTEEKTMGSFHLQTVWLSRELKDRVMQDALHWGISVPYAEAFHKSLRVREEAYEKMRQEKKFTPHPTLGWDIERWLFPKALFLEGFNWALEFVFNEAMKELS